jgi:hypothetical protein
MSYYTIALNASIGMRFLYLNKMELLRSAGYSECIPQMIATALMLTIIDAASSKVLYDPLY